MISKAAQLQADINVTPLVDVVLVLLIIFMVITPLMQAGYDVVVPPVATGPPKTPETQLVVFQLTGSKIFVNSQRVESTKLRILLSEILEHRKDKTIFFNADDELSYGLAASTMDEIRNAGASQIGIVTAK